jgi:carboxyl-terminal processing protease
LSSEPSYTPEPKNSKRYMPLLAASLLTIGIYGGYYLKSKSSPALSDVKDYHQTQGNKLGSLINYIEKNYVDTINTTELEEKAVASLLKNLDPHSDYIPAQDFDLVNEPLEGNFDGIGVEFNIINDTIRVINPIIGGPSEKLGIKAGDKIVMVNGKNMTGKDITTKTVFEKLRGKSGTTVNVSIIRSGVNKAIEFKITRGKIPLHSLDIAYLVKPGIGYMKISKFASTTYQEYSDAFNAVSARCMKKMILDLRGNGGGYLNAAVQLADEFLINGLQIVYTAGKAHPKKVYSATTKGGFEKNDLVVLIDEGSASASEIVAGALQDNDRATIIGRRSFGKGLVQDQINLPDGSAIRLTIARYYTPTGRCIQKPYEKGHTAYFSEEYERFENGELYNLDSIKLDKTKQYRTPGGKIVYGGGGIVPDIFIPVDTAKYSAYVNKLYYNGILNAFAFEYSDKNRLALQNEFKLAENFNNGFKVNEKVLNELTIYIKKNHKNINPESQKTTGLPSLLKALIGRNIFDKDAYYPNLNETDNAILKAVKLLEKKTKSI